MVQKGLLVNNLFDEMGKKLLKTPIDSLVKNRPQLQLIHWHRLVVDEFHETYTNVKYRAVKNMLQFIDSTYRWCVTATPFVKSCSLLNIVNFLTKYKNEDEEKIFEQSNFV